MNPGLRKALSSIKAAHLPSPPHTLLKVLQAFNDEEATYSSLAELIGQDTALSAKIFAVTGSAAYRRPTRITTLEQSLIALGMDMVRTIAISAAVYHAFNQLSGLSSFDLRRFWQHCLACACIARLLAKAVGYPNPEEAYLSGLLHDVGRLALLVGIPEEYEKFFALPEDRTALVSLEQQHLGTTHSEIGAWLVRSWNLQSFMADAVLFHHESAARVASSHSLVKIIIASHELSLDGVEPGDSALAATSALLGVGKEQALELVGQAHARVEQVADSLGIKLAPRSAGALEERKASGESIPARVGMEALADRQAAPAGGASRATDADHQAMSSRLMEEVRNTALLDEVHRLLYGSGSEEALLDCLVQSARVLFDVREALFFVHDPADDLLHGKHAPGQSELISELRVTPAPGNGLVAEAFLERKLASSFGKNTRSIMDDHVMGLAQAEGVLCVPMMLQKRPMGVLVFAVDSSQFLGLAKNSRLVATFANLAGSSLAALKPGTPKRSPLAALAEYESYARKIVHEVSNPLSIIKNYIKILDMKLAEGDVGKQDLKVLNEEIDRVSGIINRLPDIAQAPPRASDAVDLNSVVSAVVELCDKSLFVPHGIKVVMELDPALPAVITDRNGIKQVLLNLIKNAAEAMPEGGTLTLATTKGVNQNGIEYVGIRVCDSGPGIAPSIREHLFEPVASTKGDGHAGLGLAIVRNIIQELRGVITCRTADREGTTFEILLPRNPAA